MVQRSHPYMTNGKTIALIIWTFVGKVMFLLFNRLSRIVNTLQCSCLENPRDWGAWWAAVYGVTQSRTRLKLLSSIQISDDVCSSSSWLGEVMENITFTFITIGNTFIHSISVYGRQNLLLLLLIRFSRVRLCVTP